MRINPNKLVRIDWDIRHETFVILSCGCGQSILFIGSGYTLRYPKTYEENDEIFCWVCNVFVCTRDVRDFIEHLTYLGSLEVVYKYLRDFKNEE